MDRLQGEIQELFADLWQVPRFSGLRSGFRPQVDCYRTADPAELVVLVELPGIDPDALEIVIIDDTLTVTGSRSRPRTEGTVYQHMELEYGPFQRIVQLPDGVDVAAARASYDRGMLEIVLPLAQRAAPQARIAITVTRL